jgi:adenylate cyclase
MSMEPRSISVLFADICGSSRLHEKLGDAEALHAVERCMRRMVRAAEATKGRIVKAVGDELTVAFDSAETAVQAAGEIQQRVDALPPVSGISLAIRIGFHHGEVIEENDDIVGDTVNIASRLAGLAKAGQALTTAETVALLPPDLQEMTRAVDTITAQGKDDEIEVFELLYSRGDAGLTRHFSAQPPAVKDTRLRLRHGDQEVWLGATKPNATFGRDPHADLVTLDSRASRSHGRVERRRDKYVLVDESTNGTYVKFLGEPEFVLKGEEAILRGRGRVSFGHSSEDEGNDLLEFEVVG